MKEDAGKVGPLADLETLNQLLDEVDSTIRAGTRALAEVQESVEERQRRNAKLKTSSMKRTSPKHLKMHSTNSIRITVDGSDSLNSHALGKTLVLATAKTKSCELTTR